MLRSDEGKTAKQIEQGVGLHLGQDGQGGPLKEEEARQADSSGKESKTKQHPGQTPGRTASFMIGEEQVV